MDAGKCQVLFCHRAQRTQNPKAPGKCGFWPRMEHRLNTDTEGTDSHEAHEANEGKCAGINLLKGVVAESQGEGANSG